jgi:hypothetical protein
MVVYLNLPEETDETFAFVNKMHDIIGKYYATDSFYVVGNTTSAMDLSSSFGEDNLLISVLSALLHIHDEAGGPLLPQHTHALALLASLLNEHLVCSRVLPHLTPARTHMQVVRQHRQGCRQHQHKSHESKNARTAHIATCLATAKPRRSGDTSGFHYCTVCSDEPVRHTAFVSTCFQMPCRQQFLTKHLATPPGNG